MLKDIYIIKNIVNDKVYVGQAIDAQKRFISHKSRSKIDTDNSIIHKAMQKYGVEKFYFEILEKQISNYNEREKYWIKYFNSIYPNGYNILEGGNEPPFHKGEEHYNTELSQEQVDLLIEELLQSNKTIAEISEEYAISESIVKHINRGESWRKEQLQYPLKQIDDRYIIKDIKIIDEIQFLLKESSCSMEQIGGYYNIGRKVIARINKGQIYNNKAIDYPIRKVRQRTKENVVEALKRRA